MQGEKKVWDTIIVGGGAAGFSAALYAARRQLSTLVIAKDIGGQALLTQHIENYPGIPEVISGPDLLSRFWKQAEKYGAKTAMAEVLKVRADGDLFAVETNTKGMFTAKTVILAFGMTPQNMNVPGEEALSGKGVHYCATCDAPLFKGKTVAVVGGTNAAMDAALLCAKICPTVYLVHKRAKLVGDNELIAQIESSKTITFLPDRTVAAVTGDKNVSALEVTRGEEKETLAVEGVFVELGHVVKTECVEGLVDRDAKKAIVVDEKMQTSLPGVFACGDVSTTPYKQVVISAGEGAIAALQAYQYLQKHAGKKAVIVIDWTT